MYCSEHEKSFYVIDRPYKQYLTVLLSVSPTEINLHNIGLFTLFDPCLLPITIHNKYLISHYYLIHSGCFTGKLSCVYCSRLKTAKLLRFCER